MREPNPFRLFRALLFFVFGIFGGCLIATGVGLCISNLYLPQYKTMLPGLFVILGGLLILLVNAISGYSKDPDDQDPPRRAGR